MRATHCFVFFFTCISIIGCPTSAASLENVAHGGAPKLSSNLPARGVLLENILNYIFNMNPSSDTMSSLRWEEAVTEPDEFTQGTPNRLYYALRTGAKRDAPQYDEQELTREVTNPTNQGSRWKRSVTEPQEEETKDADSRIKRAASKTSTNSDVEEIDDNNSWWWTKATVRRSPFSPRLGKRDGEEEHFGSLYDDDLDVDTLSNDDLDDDLVEDMMTQDYTDEVVAPPRLMVRSALVPRLGKKNAAFSPRLGKRPAFIPRLGKRGDFAFSPRLGKRGDFAFSPRLGKKADFAFSPRLGKRGDFAFSPRLGKRGPDFAFSPRLGKRGDFAFSPRLGKKADFPFSPRPGKRGNAFSPRLGKRTSKTASSTASGREAWRTEDADDFSHLEQRSVAFSPRLG